MRHPITLISLLLAPTLVAQQHHYLTIAVKDAAAAQWQLVQGELAKLRVVTTAYERDNVRLTAAAELAAIPQKWPGERLYVLNGATTAAQLYLGLNDGASALKVLRDAESVLHDKPALAAVHLYMSRAFERLGNHPSARAQLVLADTEIAGGQSAVDFEVTRDVAELYTREGNFIEAAKRFRRLASFSNVNDVSAGMFLLRSARASIAAGDRGGAQSDVSELNRHIQHAKATAAHTDPGTAKLEEDLVAQGQLVLRGH